MGDEELKTCPDCDGSDMGERCPKRRASALNRPTIEDALRESYDKVYKMSRGLMQDKNSLQQQLAEAKRDLEYAYNGKHRLEDKLAEAKAEVCTLVDAHVTLRLQAAEAKAEKVNHAERELLDIIYESIATAKVKP